MIRQMTIFDFLPSRYPDINDIDESEAVRIVGDRLGVVFTYNDYFEQWECKKGKIKLSLEYDHFNLHDNHDLFLGVGYDCRNPVCGGGSPCASIEQAIRYFERIIQEHG